MLPEPARISILTVSDRASRGEYADQGGPAAEAWLQRTITSPIEVSRLIVPDGRDTVADALCGFAEESIDLVLVTGGRTAPCASARTSCATSRPAAPTVATPAAPVPRSVRLCADTSRAGGVSCANGTARFGNGPPDPRWAQMRYAGSPSADKCRSPDTQPRGLPWRRLRGRGSPWRCRTPCHPCASSAAHL